MNGYLSAICYAFIMLTFRRKIILFALLLTLIVAIPSVVILGQRPWDELRGMIAQGSSLLSAIHAAIPDGDMVAINNFVLKAIESAPAHAKDMNTPFSRLDEEDFAYTAPSLAFYMLLDFDRLLTQAEVEGAFEEEEIEYDDFDYGLIPGWYRYWQEKFAENPPALAAFRRTRALLVKTAEATGESDLAVADIYLMLDVGQVDSGYFKNSLAYVLESLPWWDATFPGEPFDMVKNESEDWRESYHPQSNGEPGHHHNLIHNPDNWYLPAFDTDEWGTWFTVWLTPEPLGEDPAVYTVFNVDFDAGVVVTMMQRIGIMLIISATVVVLLLILMTSVISRRLSTPILDLTEGVDAVMAQRFDHQVPSETKDEFHHLIEVFNWMIISVKHMVNLKDTLSRMLSEELAEQATEKGLTLGGQQVECSIMFTDFAGFSSLTSHMPAEKVVSLLNHYFEELIPIVKRWGGFPDKYIGDAIVAIFGAHIQLDDHAERAVKCAVEMQQKIRELNQALISDGDEFFHMRIGINSGEVIVGAIGCDLKLEFTSIGEATNLANRMESVCPIGHIMLSAATMELCGNCLPPEVEVPEVPQNVMVKGYEDAIEAFPVWIDGLRIEKQLGKRRAIEFYQRMDEQ